MASEDIAEISRKIEAAISKNNLEEVVGLLEDVLVAHPRPEFSEQPALATALVLSAATVAPSKVHMLLERLSSRIDADSVVPALFQAGLEDEARFVLSNKQQ